MKKLYARLFSAPARARKPRPTFRPGVEEFEGRLVPASWYWSPQIVNMQLSHDFNAGSNYVDANNVRQGGSVDGHDLVFDGTKTNGGEYATLSADASPNSMVMQLAAPSISLWDGSTHSLTVAASSTFKTGGFDMWRCDNTAVIKLNGSNDVWTGTQITNSFTGTYTGKLWLNDTMTIGTSTGSTHLDTKIEISGTTTCSTSCGRSIDDGYMVIDAGGKLVCSIPNSSGQSWAVSSGHVGPVYVDGVLDVKQGGTTNGTLTFPYEVRPEATAAQVTLEAESKTSIADFYMSDGKWACYEDTVADTQLTTTANRNDTMTGGTFSLVNAGKTDLYTDNAFAMSGGVLDVNSNGVSAVFNVSWINFNATGGVFDMTGGSVNFGIQPTGDQFVYLCDLMMANITADFKGTLNVVQLGSLSLPSGTKVDEMYYSPHVSTGFTGSNVSMTFGSGAEIYDAYCTGWAATPAYFDLYLIAK